MIISELVKDFPLIVRALDLSHDTVADGLLLNHLIFL